MRELSGWKIDDPIPTIIAATITETKLVACDSSSSPTRVKPMPSTSE